MTLFIKQIVKEFENKRKLGKFPITIKKNIYNDLTLANAVVNYFNSLERYTAYMKKQDLFQKQRTTYQYTVVITYK